MIELLRRYLRESAEILRYNVKYVSRRGYDILRSDYERIVVRNLIAEIRKYPNKDPYQVMEDIYWELDDILCEEECAPEVHTHACIMENIVCDVLRFVRKEMK